MFGDKKKKKKSWRRLSFAHKKTPAAILAEEQAISHRVTRLVTTVFFAVLTTLIVGAGLIDPKDVPRWTGLLGFVLLIHFAMLVLVRQYHAEVLQSVRTFSRYFLLLGIFLGASRGLLILPEVSAYLLPLPLLAMSLALIYRGPLAIHTSLALAVLVGLMASLRESRLSGAEEELMFTWGPTFVNTVASLFFGSVVAVLGVARLRRRTRLGSVGFAAGTIQFLVISVLQLWGSAELSIYSGWEFFQGPLAGFISGLGSGILITSALPFMERLFDITTDLRLIELGDQNRPVLREFQLLAPGSFQHSLMVGQLAEEAAKSIGANDLLARVGALYHDIGKMMKPSYFVENINQDDNPHERLSPEMSRLIIISHVKDGIRIAREERLPHAIVDMIPMHHGTSVVEYFYHKKRQQEEAHGLSESGEEAFQYPGPKPTFREAGILMLADTTEAISRVLSDPTPARLRTVVRQVIYKRMSTGQLDECELTMHDLSRIEDAFVRVLASIHHGRIRYPGETDQKGPRGGGTGGGDRDRRGEGPGEASESSEEPETARATSSPAAGARSAK